MPSRTAINEETLHNLKGIIIADDVRCIAIIFARGHDAEGIAGLEQDDAGHQVTGKGECVVLGEGKRHVLKLLILSGSHSRSTGAAKGRFGTFDHQAGAAGLAACKA